VNAIVGLGNPGRRYLQTRHNIGFLTIDFLLEDYKIPLQAGKGDYYYSELEIAGKRIIVVKPTTFMNRSGIAVRQVTKYFPVHNSEILVIYDDFNLPFGTLRFRKQGSDGGHNGIRSIINELGTDFFNRLRFGIGNDFVDSVKFVLSKFSRQEKVKLRELIQTAVEGVVCWSENGIDHAMNKYNQAYI
jgi:PTH1 family peptidyl-tRNA hydrolase